MTITETWFQLPNSEAVGGVPSSPVLAVVGFDGSGSARTALTAAASMIRGRAGHLEVVFVGHISTPAAMTAPTLLASRGELAAIARQLDGQVRDMLDDREPRWHFQHRDGSVVRELAAAAVELRARAVSGSTIAIVVGSSRDLVTKTGRSVSVRLARRTIFPLVVVPMTSVATTNGGRARY